MKKTLLLVITALCLLSLEVAAQDSWQWTRKMGTNHSYDFNEPKVLKTLMDSRGHQYVVYYITGDTFYYGNSYKRFIRGGDGYALCKITCDGSLAWCKIITHARKNKADLQPDNLISMFFGKDENTIVIGGGVSNFANTYIDTDTTLGVNTNGYTIIYDSSGVAKKKVANKDKQLGLSYASGYFPRTNQYVNGASIDSTAVDRVFFDGKYLSAGEYYVLLDTNFNYVKIVPVVTFKKSFSSIDSTDPAPLGLAWLPNCQIYGSKLFFEIGGYLFFAGSPQKAKYLVLGKDTIKLQDLVGRIQFSIYCCYNDTGGQEWTRFFYPFKNTNLPYFSTYEVTNKSLFIKLHELDSWKFHNTLINPYSSTGQPELFLFKVDSSGNFLWRSHAQGFSTSHAQNRYPACNSKGELILNLTAAYNNGITINNQFITAYKNTTFTKHILVAVRKDSVRIIDSNTDQTRNTVIDRITIDPADNIYIHGIKKINGCILNNDSSAIQYDLGQDNFIAKYGKATCSCDPLRSAYKTLDSTTEGRITLQYTGLPSDSVRYLWGDGSWTLAKPSTSPTTKIYNQTRSVTIICVSYNNCGQTDSFRKTYQITCTALTSRFSIKDSLNKTISLQYTGTATDSVRYLWGDGSSAWAVNPSTKLMTHTYSTVLDSVSVSAIVRNKCGQADTFRRWVRFCPKPSVVISIDTSQRLQNKISVAYTGPDSITYYWGDNTSTTQKSVTKTYGSGGAYLIKWVVRNKCGARDSLTKLVMVGSLSLSSIVNNSQIRIYPNPAKDVVYVYPIYNAISLYNALGQELRLSSKIEGDQVRIDLGLLPENIYYLKIEDEKGVTLKMERLEIKRR